MPAIRKPQCYDTERICTMSGWRFRASTTYEFVLQLSFSPSRPNENFGRLPHVNPRRSFAFRIS